MIIECELNLNNKTKDELICLLKDATRIIQKQERTIQNMATYIAGLDIEEDICSKMEKSNECDKFAFGECEKCIINFFSN